ncbi:translation protein, partial [Basidiobolus meristosporus CBS 931.73]
KGLRATHGVSLSHRSIGSTGQRTDPGKVFKGKKMPGRLGGDRVTVQNLKVVKIDLGLNCIYVKGAVPGVDDAYVRIRDSLKK